MTGEPLRPTSGPHFAPAFLAEVRARTRLATLIGRDVRLSRAGSLWKGLCPFHGERRPSFCVYPDHYHCFSCGAHGDAIDYIVARRGATFLDAVAELAAEAGMISVDATAPPKPLQPVRTPPPDQRPQKHKAALAMFLDAQEPIFDTPVEDYLKNRGIDLRSLGGAPRALRFHPALWHGGVKLRLPAMVAAISGADGQHIATHRTWLERAGGGWIKARIPDNKMVLGAFAGGSIRLWRGASGKSLKDAPPDDRVVIGEGIETCLSIVLACPEFRVLSAISLGNMGAVKLPDQLEKIVLAADNDAKPAARQALRRAIERHIAAGREVRVAHPPEGSDFNDVLTGNIP